MSYSGYSEHSNVNFKNDPTQFADNSSQIKGVGCAGTNNNSIAASSKYVGGKYKRKHMGGSSGYSFTNTPISVTGPSAPYSEIKHYNDTASHRNLFPASFKNGGGKKNIQYGCSKKLGGKKHITNKRKHSKRKHSKRKHSKRNHSKRKHSKRKHIKKTFRKTTRSIKRKMFGGMSDYTAGQHLSQSQPYSNQAISFGQGLSYDTTINSNNSYMASPTPLSAYNNCGNISRN